MGKFVKDKNVYKIKSRIQSLVYMIEERLDAIDSTVYDIDYYDSDLDEIAYQLQTYYMELGHTLESLEDIKNYSW